MMEGGVSVVDISQVVPDAELALPPPPSIQHNSFLTRTVEENI